MGDIINQSPIITHLFHFWVEAAVGIPCPQRLQPQLVFPRPDHRPRLATITRALASRWTSTPLKTALYPCIAASSCSKAQTNKEQLVTSVPVHRHRVRRNVVGRIGDARAH